MSTKSKQYFATELELIEKMLAERREALTKTPKGKPHPYCECGQDMCYHLKADIAALEALQALMAEEDMYPLYVLIEEKQNPLYADYAIRNLFRKGEITRAESLATRPELDRLTYEVLVKLGKWLLGTESPPKPSSISYGMLADVMAQGFAAFVIATVQNGGSPN